MDVLQKIRLVPHPTARSQSIATMNIPAGALILSTPSFATVLLPSEKGRRCDMCFRLATDRSRLRKCSGCASYWYCDETCQNAQWKLHHRKICKAFNRFIASESFLSLPENEKMDSLLLSHVLAQEAEIKKSADKGSFIAILLSLLPGPTHRDGSGHPPCLPVSAKFQDLVDEIYARFENNNFAIHSHLVTIGHGVFPLASRLFNHSCEPNAAVKYVISPAKSAVMDVIALRDIDQGDEICLTYLDPALLQMRHDILELTYGFACNCASCQHIEKLKPFPVPPTDQSKLHQISLSLQDFTGVSRFFSTGLPIEPTRQIPEALTCVLHENYLSNLSETFSRAAHEWDYGLALQSGMTLLALYVMIYPPNYPQIGMHLLELAKTTWNMMVSSTKTTPDREREIQNQVLILLSSAQKVLSVFGAEGDDDGPLKEIETLQVLLDE